MAGNIYSVAGERLSYITRTYLHESGTGCQAPRLSCLILMLLLCASSVKSFPSLMSHCQQRSARLHLRYNHAEVLTYCDPNQSGDLLRACVCTCCAA